MHTSTTMAIETDALRAAIGDERFDALFGSDDPAIDAMVTNRLVISQGNGAVVNDFLVATDANIASRGARGLQAPVEEYQHLLKPGEWYYISNHPKYLLKHPGGAWQGENSIYKGLNAAGERVWSGFGASDLSEDQMLDHMVTAYNAPRNAADERALLEGGSKLADGTYTNPQYDPQSGAFDDQINRSKLLDDDAFTLGGYTRKGVTATGSGAKSSIRVAWAGYEDLEERIVSGTRGCRDDERVTLRVRLLTLRVVASVSYALTAMHSAAAAPRGRSEAHAPTHAKHGGLMTSQSSEVEIRLAGEYPGRPPLTRFSLDVVLRNSSPDPRWFVLPTNLPAPARGGVDKLEVYELAGKGRAVVGRFLGTGGFQGRARSRWWRSEAASAFDRLLGPASRRRAYLRGGDREAGHRRRSPDPQLVLGRPDQRRAGADVSGEERMTASHRTSDGKEVPVSLAEDHRVSVRVELTPP